MRSSTTPNPVNRDIQNVVTDAQDLLKTVQSEGEGKLNEMRGKVQAQIDAARQTLAELQSTVTDSAKVAMNSTDEYVRANPWRAVGISAGIGALIGFLIARR
jgi:ElaB protein